MYNKILVPLDGSEISECSLTHVQAIATGCSVPEVALIKVIEPIPETGWIAASERKDSEKRAREYAQDYLTKLAGKLEKKGIEVTTVIASGNIAEKILEYAQGNKIDLIIMSTHGSSGVVRWALGSVADKVSRHASMPVLVIPPESCKQR